MNKLDLIWELENYSNDMRELQDQLKQLYKKEAINDIKLVVENRLQKLNDLEDQLYVIQKDIKKSELALKGLKFTLNQQDEDLFGGKIQNIKELELLSKEKEGTVKKYDSLETEILLMLDKEENIKKEFEGNKYELELQTKELLNLEQSNKYEIGKINEEIERLNPKIKSLRDIIPHIDLEAYDAIRNSKTFGIVKVDNYTCTGCNMKIPTYMGKSLKAKKEIITCENCGRILYYL